MANLYGDRLFTALDKRDPEPGTLVVAAPGTEDPSLARNVFLILEHNAHITVGVGLAQRSDIAVANVQPGWEELTKESPALHIGGPEGHPGVLGVGINAPGIEFDRYPHLLNKITNRIVLVDLTTDPSFIGEELQAVRFFAGYKQWAPGDLQAEIDAGDWYVAPALPADVITKRGADVWGDVLRRQAMPLPLFATFPRELEEN